MFGAAEGLPASQCDRVDGPIPGPASVMPAGMFDFRRFEQLEDPAAKQNYRAAKGRPTGG